MGGPEQAAHLLFLRVKGFTFLTRKLTQIRYGHKTY